MKKFINKFFVIQFTFTNVRMEDKAYELAKILKQEYLEDHDHITHYHCYNDNFCNYDLSKEDDIVLLWKEINKNNCELNTKTNDIILLWEEIIKDYEYKMNETLNESDEELKDKIKTSLLNAQQEKNYWISKMLWHDAVKKSYVAEQIRLHYARISDIGRLDIETAVDYEKTADVLLIAADAWKKTIESIESMKKITHSDKLNNKLEYAEEEEERIRKEEYNYRAISEKRKLPRPPKEEYKTPFYEPRPLDGLSWDENEYYPDASIYETYVYHISEKEECRMRILETKGVYSDNKKKYILTEEIINLETGSGQPFGGSESIANHLIVTIPKCETIKTFIKRLNLSENYELNHNRGYDNTYLIYFNFISIKQIIEIMDIITKIFPNSTPERNHIAHMD